MCASELQRTWSTAFCCCRAPPKNRYGSLLPRGVRGREGDVLSKLPFDFSEEDQERSNLAPVSGVGGHPAAGGVNGTVNSATSAADAKPKSSRVCCSLQRKSRRRHNSSTFRPDNDVEVGECRCCQCYTSFSARNLCDCLTAGCCDSNSMRLKYFSETVGFYLRSLNFTRQAHAALDRWHRAVLPSSLPSAN